VEYIGATTTAPFELPICHSYSKRKKRIANCYDSFDKLLDQS